MKSNADRLPVVVIVLLVALAAPTAGRAQEPPGGWSAREGREVAPPPPSEPLSSEDQERYDRVAVRLVETLNARDREAYRALFTEDGWATAIPWFREMFAVQFERFGSILEAYPARRGLVRVGEMAVGADDVGGAAILIRFEEPAGGVLSFRLGDDDRIEATSVFIHPSLGIAKPDGLEPIYPREATDASAPVD